MSIRSSGVALGGLVAAIVLLAALPASAAVVSLNLNPSTIAGGSGDLSTGTVTLDAPAPSGGITVDLASSNAALAASTPSVVVPAGATTATFLVGTNSRYRPFSGSAFDVSVTARSRTDGTSAAALLHVTAQPIPGPFTGGTRSTDQQARDGNICGSAFGSGSASARGILFRCQFLSPGAFSTCTFLQECEFGCQETQETATLGFPVTVADTCAAEPPAPIALSQERVVGGQPASGTLLLSKPAPRFSEAQVSSNPPMVSPLGNFPIPEGATTAPFTISTGEVAVPTFLPLNASVFLSPLFRFDQDFLAIVPAPGAPIPSGPLAVFSVGLRPTQVVGGNAEFVVATVSLNGVAPSGGAVVALSSGDTAVATVPASVTVPAGQTNAFVSVTTSRVTADTPVAITATLGGVSRSATLTVLPPPPPVTLAGISLSPPGVAGGSSSTGTVFIDPAAPPGGTVVPLASSHAIATVPSTVLVPAGATRATFTVTTSAVSATTAVTISGSLNFASQQATLTVSPSAPAISLSTFSISPTSLVGGGFNSATGTVTLTAPAPSGGANVNLARDSASVFVPAWITVPAGATSATFTIGTAAVTESKLVTITAGFGTTTRTASLTLDPASIVSLAVNPSTVTGGQSSTGTVTLAIPAPTGGSVVALSSVGAVVTIPSSVTVPAGATSATFPIATSPVSETFNANLFARLDGVEKQALLVVQPSGTAGSLSAVAVSPPSVAGGGSCQGTVTLTGPAPAGGTSVSLSTSSSAAAAPGSVTVAAGASSASFTVSTSPVASTTSVTLSAGAGGVTRTTTLAVTPASTGTVSSAPSLVSPANRTTVAQPVTFDWSDVANAASYELQIDDSNSFSAPLTRSVVVSASQATVTGLPAQQLHWRVRGIAASGAAGPFSSSRRFTAQTATATPTLAALAVSPTSVAGGASAQGTVTLTAAAPSGGAAVSLASSSGVASVPASVTVPAGATTASFSIATAAVAATTTVTLTATWSGASRSASLTVTVPQAGASLGSVAVSPTTVDGGVAAQGTVTLTAAAPSGGAVVALASSSGAASVPASVTVPAGATTASFAVTTAAVGATTSVTISASYAGVTRTAALTLTSSAPPQAFRLDVTATGRSGERVRSSPAGIDVAVGTTGSATFAAGTSIALSVTNGRDAVWSGACSSGGNKTRSCTFTIAADASVTANVQ